MSQLRRFHEFKYLKELVRIRTRNRDRNIYSLECHCENKVKWNGSRLIYASYSQTDETSNRTPAIHVMEKEKCQLLKKFFPFSSLVSVVRQPLRGSSTALDMSLMNRNKSSHLCRLFFKINQPTYEIASHPKSHQQPPYKNQPI